MAIGELLLAKGIISEEQLKAVLQQQKIAGGRLGDNLVALGFLSRGDLDFIPIVNAELTPLNGDPPETREFVAVARTHVQLAFPYQPGT